MKDKKNKEKDIFHFDEENSEDQTEKDKSLLDDFEVVEKKKPTKKPFSFYLDIRYNQLLEERIDQIEREAKRKGVNIDISKSKLLEKILDDYFGI
jgi:hypothetical protein